MKPFACQLLSAILITMPLEAATITFSITTTSTTANIEDRPSSLSSAGTYTANLNDRTGLTPGAPILLTLQPETPALWTGGFGYQPGELRVDFAATLRMFAGADSISDGVAWGQTFFPTECAACGANSGVAGYMEGPSFGTLSLIVPWDADLTRIRIELTQTATIAGNEAFFTQSGVGVTGSTSSGTLELALASVPEPGVFALTLLPLAAALRRRRN